MLLDEQFDLIAKHLELLRQDEFEAGAQRGQTARDDDSDWVRDAKALDERVKCLRETGRAAVDHERVGGPMTRSYVSSLNGHLLGKCQRGVAKF